MSKHPKPGLEFLLYRVDLGQQVRIRREVESLFPSLSSIYPAALYEFQSEMHIRHVFRACTFMPRASASWTILLKRFYILVKCLVLKPCLSVIKFSKFAFSWRRLSSTYLSTWINSTFHWDRCLASTSLACCMEGKIGVSSSILPLSLVASWLSSSFRSACCCSITSALLSFEYCECFCTHCIQRVLHRCVRVPAWGRVES